MKSQTANTKSSTVKKKSLNLWAWPVAEPGQKQSLGTISTQVANLHVT
jgi:hypothetical protein